MVNEPVEMRRGRAFGLVLGALLVISGIAGFAAVRQYWSDSICPSTGTSCLPHSALNQSNSTTIIVGSVVSTATLVLGGLIIFIASYFPYPPQSGENSRASAQRSILTEPDGEPTDRQASHPVDSPAKVK